MTKSIIKDDLRYQVFSELYLKFTEPKARRKAFAILEASVKCYAKKGWERTTIEMIAREVGESRTQIQYYFPKAEELRELAIRYVRLMFQQFAIDKMTNEKSPKAMLEVYLRSCFRWVDQSKTHALLWLSFLHAASSNEKDQNLNTTAVLAGSERLISLVKAGILAEQFHCEDPEGCAKVIQVLITGAMISYASETLPNTKKFEDMIIEKCFCLLT